MASLYKKKIKRTDPKTGKKTNTKSKKWYGRYRDAWDCDRRVALATDKAAAQAMLNELVRKAEREKAGLIDPTEEQRKRPLLDHLKDYKQHLTDVGSTHNHVQSTVQRVRDIINACKFKTIADIKATSVQSFLANYRKTGKSITSSNHYLRAFKMFTRWLVKNRRTRDDPVAHLSALNPEPDKRRNRRPLTENEFQRLLTAAQTGPRLQNIAGPDRVIIYLLAANTGFRRREIGSITSRSFDFRSNPPTLTVEAGYSKHRQIDVIPLRRDLADIIEAWLTSKPDLAPDTLLFDISKKKTSELIRKDLEHAGILYVDEDGRHDDFHALRKTFITNLSLAGVPPKTAQSLARHSDINLTMNTYTSIAVSDQAGAVEQLPAIVLPDQTCQGEATPAKDDGGEISSPEKVPSMVPRSANIGANGLASEALQDASDCIESKKKTERASTVQNDTNHNGKETYDSSLQCVAAICSQVPEAHIEPLNLRAELILNPARLPIPPQPRFFDPRLSYQQVFALVGSANETYYCYLQ